MYICVNILVSYRLGLVLETHQLKSCNFDCNVYIK